MPHVKKKMAGPPTILYLVMVNNIYNTIIKPAVKNMVTTCPSRAIAPHENANKIADRLITVYPPYIRSISIGERNPRIIMTIRKPKYNTVCPKTSSRKYADGVLHGTILRLLAAQCTPCPHKYKTRPDKYMPLTLSSR